MISYHVIIHHISERLVYELWSSRPPAPVLATKRTFIKWNIRESFFSQVVFIFPTTSVFLEFSVMTTWSIIKRAWCTTCCGSCAVPVCTDCFPVTRKFVYIIIILSQLEITRRGHVESKPWRMQWLLVWLYFRNPSPTSGLPNTMTS